MSSTESPSAGGGSKPGIGTATAASNKDGDPKTWDGYGKFNNIPVNPDQPPSTPKMSKEEFREKFSYLRKLKDLERKGVNFKSRYGIFFIRNGEYETAINDRQTKNSVKFQGRMLMAAITGLEFLNNKFDPFDLKLDGWPNVNENLMIMMKFLQSCMINKSKAKMAPELKLLFQLGSGYVAYD